MLARQHGSSLAQSSLREPNLTVARIMRTDFRSCNASASLIEVAAALAQKGRPFLPVTRAEIPVGIVTDRSVMEAVAKQECDPAHLTAAQLMTEDVATIPASATVAETLDRLPGAGGCLLAVDQDGRLRGLVTVVELATQLSDTAFRRLMTEMGSAASHVGQAAAEAPPADQPSAEIKPTKSQAQPHPWDSPTGAEPHPVPLVSPSDLANPMLKVADALSAAPRTASPESTVVEAVLVLRESDSDVVPVTESGRPVGFVSDRDIALALAEHERDLGDLPLKALMTRDLETVEADSPLGAAVKSLEEHGTRQLMVVDGAGQLVGLLGVKDLLPHLSDRALGQVVSRILKHH